MIAAHPPFWHRACIHSRRMLDGIGSRLEHYMNLLSIRQKLAASNIANIDTPGYRTKDLDFQFEYMSLVKGGSPNVFEVDGLTVKNDGNNVSLDRETRMIAENALRFNVASSLLKSQIRLIQKAIQEGKGA